MAKEIYNGRGIAYMAKEAYKAKEIYCGSSMWRNRYMAKEVYIATVAKFKVIEQKREN